MKRIWKFELLADQRTTTVDMPRNAEVLSTAFQGQALFVWALVRPAAPVEERTFAVYGTGHDVPEDEAAEFIGTAHLNDGGSPLVFHVFDLVRG